MTSLNEGQKINFEIEQDCAVHLSGKTDCSYFF